MKLKEGQTVRAFGIVKDSWVLAEVVSIQTDGITVLVKDWVGLPRASHYILPYTQVEPIAGGHSL